MLELRLDMRVSVGTRMAGTARPMTAPCNALVTTNRTNLAFVGDIGQTLSLQPDQVFQY